MANIKLEMVLQWLIKHGVVSELDSDIVKTAEVLYRNPFNQIDAKKIVVKNNVKYRDIELRMATVPGTVRKELWQMTDMDCMWKLSKQLEGLCDLKMQEKSFCNGNNYISHGGTPQ